MINIYVGLNDKNIEKLLRIFIEKFYYIKVSDLSDIEGSKALDSAVLVADRDFDFPGYKVIVADTQEPFLCLNEKSFIIGSESLELVYFLMAIDDIFGTIKMANGSVADDSFIKWPREYISLLDGIEGNYYVKVGSIRFKPIELKELKISDDLYVRKKDSFLAFARLEKYFLNIVEDEGAHLSKRIVSAQDMAKIIGISSETVKAVDALVDNLISSLESNKSLKSLLQSFDFKEDQYFEMIKLTMYAAKMLCKSESSLNNEGIFKKVITAALFMDMTLETESTKMILNVGEIANEGFTREDRNNIRNHPVHSATKLNQFMEFGRDELSLIERHHEKPNGTGFPKALHSESMSVLQNLFITAYHFSHYMTLSVGPEDISTDTLRKVVDKMTNEGFASGPTLKFFSVLSKLAQE